MNKKRIAAIIGLILIGLLYLATLALAFLDSPFARNCLMASLFCTIVVPAVLYGYITFLGSGSSKRQEESKGKTGLTNEAPEE